MTQPEYIRQLALNDAKGLEFAMVRSAFRAAGFYVEGEE